MNLEIQLIAGQMKQSYQGEPWFGRSVSELLSEVDESIAFEKINGQHSILELIWHMVTWKEFTVSRLRLQHKQLAQFESEDWRELDHNDKTLWKKGIEHFERIHNELVTLVQQQEDDILPKKVHERNYDFRNLLNGIVQHDIYHIGQIAYVKKLCEARKTSTV
jgi:uncharacterized damage-inducible protein DinB